MEGGAAVHQHPRVQWRRASPSYAHTIRAIGCYFDYNPVVLVTRWASRSAQPSSAPSASAPPSGAAEAFPDCRHQPVCRRRRRPDEPLLGG